MDKAILQKMWDIMNMCYSKCIFYLIPFHDIILRLIYDYLGYVKICRTFLCDRRAFARGTLLARIYFLARPLRAQRHAYPLSGALAFSAPLRETFFSRGYFFRQAAKGSKACNRFGKSVEHCLWKGMKPDTFSRVPEYCTAPKPQTHEVVYMG